jgi:hypothetical protein
VSTSSKPDSVVNTRNIIIVVVVLAILLVGYCATRVASVARTMVDATKGIQARMDTTHHVAAGSAVFLGDTKVADIIKVIVSHADTSTPASARGKLDSTIQAGLRQETVIYSIAQPAPDVSTQLNDVTLVGKVDGTYDDTVPVQIVLSHRTQAATSLPPVQLLVPGRRQPISVY